MYLCKGTNASYVEDISNVEMYESDPGRKKQVYFNFKSNYKISEKIINEISKLKKNVYIT